MSRRIEIELTSQTGDGAYTWRAAGARQPKGTVAAGLLPSGASVGDVVRAEVESALDGVEVVAVLARPGTEDRPSNRIEVIGSPRGGPDVSVSYASGGRRRRDDTERGDQTHGRRSKPPRDAGARRPVSHRAPGDASGADRAGPTRRVPSDGSGRADRGGSRSEPRAFERGSRPNGPGARERDARERNVQAPDEDAGADRRGRAGQGEGRLTTTVRRERKPSVSTAHRNALLATLGPQELPIAEQLLRGGIPAVRQALAEQAAGQPADGGVPTNREAVLAIAEQLLPRVNLANWKDRAKSAQAAGKEFRLRELRAVVTSARTVSLDDEARTLARALQEALDQRVRALREEWVGRMSRALDDGRVLDAIRLSARAPEPASRVPAELAVRLAEAAGAEMTADLAPSDWTALLGAVVESPVRRTVKPRGLPADPGAKDAARHAAGSVPELAKLLGLRIPPPPPRRPVGARPGSGQRVMAAGGAGGAGAH